MDRRSRRACAGTSGGPKKTMISRLVERRGTRVKAAALGVEGPRGAGPLASVTGRHVLIGREMFVYFVGQDQLDVKYFDLLRSWNRQGATSLRATTGKVTSPEGMQ